MKQLIYFISIHDEYLFNEEKILPTSQETPYLMNYDVSAFLYEKLAKQ